MFTEKITIDKGRVYLLFDKEENFIGRAFIEDVTDKPIKVFTYVDKKYEKEYEDIAGSVYRTVNEDFTEKDKIKMEFVMRFLVGESTRTVVFD